MLAFSITEILNILKEYGLEKGIFVILICGIFYILLKRVSSSFDQTIEAKEKEILRLVEDNKSYREIFSDLMKKNLNLPNNEDS